MSKKSTSQSLEHNPSKRLESLYMRITGYIEQARQVVKQTVDTEMVKAYWFIGRDIVEEEQEGKERAKYGSEILASLSEKLLVRYGKSFSISTLKNIRQFYLTYKEGTIGYAPCSQSRLVYEVGLGWSHFRKLMRISRLEARQFYEIETIKNNWNSRELERQVDSLLFDRLAKSTDKEGLLQLVNKGQEILKPSDAIKDPIVLEFLGIPESRRLVESKLEEALIDNLQHFLLELGKGFAFIARQKRLTIEDDHFYADLVFYHVILKCYVIIDLKTKKLSHADLGQIQLYVNYFDEEIATEEDNPTIGLVLCTHKNDTMVKYALGKQNKQIFASRYQLYLPTEEELQAEIKREVEEIRHLKKHQDNVTDELSKPSDN